MARFVHLMTFSSSDPERCHASCSGRFHFVAVPEKMDPLKDYRAMMLFDKWGSGMSARSMIFQTCSISLLRTDCQSFPFPPCRTRLGLDFFQETYTFLKRRKLELCSKIIKTAFPMLLRQSHNCGSLCYKG